MTSWGRGQCTGSLVWAGLFPVGAVALLGLLTLAVLLDTCLDSWQTSHCPWSSPPATGALVLAYSHPDRPPRQLPRECLSAECGQRLDDAPHQQGQWWDCQGSTNFPQAVQPWATGQTPWVDRTFFVLSKSPPESSLLLRDCLRRKIRTSQTFSFERKLLSFSCSVMSDSLRPHGLCPPGSSFHGMNFPYENTGVCCHFLLQGIFQTQGSGSPALPADSLPSQSPGKPPTHEYL